MVAYITGPCYVVASEVIRSGVGLVGGVTEATKSRWGDCEGRLTPCAVFRDDFWRTDGAPARDYGIELRVCVIRDTERDISARDERNLRDNDIPTPAQLSEKSGHG